jgi:leucyl aminopeptidase
MYTKTMKINVKRQDIIKFQGDTVIVNLFEGVTKCGGATGAVDRMLNGMIHKLIRQKEFTGTLGETALIHTFGKIPADRVIVVGLGASKDFSLEKVRKAAGAAAQAAYRVKARSVGTIVHGAGIGGLDPGHACQALVEGTLLALYTFPRYKKSTNPQIQELTIVEKDKRKAGLYRTRSAQGGIIARCQNIARDFINEPANHLTPIKLYRKLKITIQELGLSKKITCTVLDSRAMKKKRMGALLSVAQGSTNSPQLIILHYKNSKKPLFCLIGKTVTFDSGGISIKPSAGMERMKGDMSGGAAVIGATLAAVLLGLKVNLMTIIPAVENMPSGKASRPGDIVRAMNGKTIEIISTDAEGRMTLADALCYAESKKARSIVDIATLTGGCVVALGDITAAVMGNDQPFIDMLLQAAECTGEKHWPLPLFDEYKEQIKTPIADVKNSGGRKASAITAGLFLSMFVNKARWIHLDIAGKEIAEKAHFYTPIGGTGFGVRTLIELLSRSS